MKYSSKSVLALILFLVCAMCHPAVQAAGNPFYIDEGPDNCGLQTSGSAEGVINAYYQCIFDKWMQSREPDSLVTGFSLNLKNCTTTRATLTTNGLGQCDMSITTYTSDGKSTEGQPGHASAPQCAQMTIMWGPPATSPQCLAYGDVYDICPVCADKAFGDPIYPLTGARREAIPLGMSIGGRAVKITYDTTNNLPGDGVGVNMALMPPPAFGDLWMSSLHKRLIRQNNGGAVFHGAALYRGAQVATFAAGGSIGCDGRGGNNTTASSTYVSTMKTAAQISVPGGPGADAPALYTDPDELVEESYNSNSGAIDSSSFVQGGSLTYVYSTDVIPNVAPAAGLLIKVVDHFGRSILYAYEQPDASVAPRVKTITGPDGAVTQVTYNQFGSLASLTWPDQNVRTFRYGRHDLPWAMTGVTDEAQAVYSIFDYDLKGRASGTKLAGGVDAYTVHYGQLPSWSVTETQVSNMICRHHHMVPPTQTTVTDSAGVAVSLDAISVNGATRLSRASTPAGSGSPGSSTADSFDGNGNVTAHLDANGVQSCYSYDASRNLELARVEGRPGTLANGAANICPSNLSGYAPSTSDPLHPERMITTVWHPNWALKARLAQPKRITTWVYNGQPDPIGGGTAACAPSAPPLPDGKPIAVLCARYEQATADETGAQGVSAAVSGATRVWTYTYNQFGQVLSETAPKLSPTDALSHTTTYVYYSDTSMSAGAGHTIGDLQSITNPLRQTTNFTSYDGAGRLLASNDANGVVTTETYWPRGWLKSQTVTPPGSAAPQVTTYDYWPTGLLKTVTLPDASTVNYAYDDAHRLTDVTDSVGNKLHYVLDDVGNRTSEQVTDASGSLASTVTRVFDALNRVQSQTGLAH